MKGPVVWVSAGMFAWQGRRLADNALLMLREWTAEPSEHVFIHMDPVNVAGSAQALTYRTAHAGPFWRVLPGHAPAHADTLGRRAVPTAPADLQRMTQDRPLVVHATSIHLSTMGAFWRPLHPDVLSYEVMENVADMDPPLAALHRAVSAEADIVVSISDATTATLATPRERLLEFGSGVDMSFWRRPPAVPRWTFGFFGNLMNWIDFDLLGALARAMPDDRIVLIGPVSPDSTARVSALLAEHRQVVYQPAVPYAALPDLVRHMAVGLLPRTHAPRSLAADPLKLYEYLAAGKPVVTSIPVPDAVASHVYYGAAPDEFVAACRQARDDWRAGRHRPWSPGVRALLEERSWRRRAAAIWERALARMA